MSKLLASVEPVAELPPALSADMYALYSDYYEGLSETVFFEDLRAKDYVVLLHDASGRLRGFSTVAVIETSWQGRPLRALYSGDTIIHHAYWGEQTLILSWFELAGRIKREKPGEDLFWFLIVKGHRTYRLLHIFCKDYAPRRLGPSSPGMLDRMRTLAEMKFGHAYSHADGLVDFGKSRGHLKPRWADAEDKIRQNVEIAYFLTRNPDYRRGVELVCLAELSEANLRYFALSGFKQGLYGSEGLERRTSDS